MPFVQLNDFSLHYQEFGSKDGAPVVFANPLGTDLRIWSEVLGLLPQSLRLICFDLRGQGQSEVTPSPYRMGQMISDTEALLDQLGIRDAVFVGIGLGGLIAQGLATKRLDQIRALVLSGTAPRIGAASHWDRRGIQALADGLDPLLAPTMERWFSAKLRRSADLTPWREMFLQQSAEGYAGACAAISGTDFYTTTAELRLPSLILAGREDGVTPPDLMRELADLIPGSTFVLMRASGHLPPVDSPAEFAAHLTEFLTQIAHG